MARNLKEPPPTSAVARLLNREVANRAIEPIRRELEPTLISEPSRSDPSRELNDGSVPRTKREFILSDDAEATFSDLLSLFRRGTQTRLTASQMFRSMLKAVKQVLPVLQYEANQLGRMRLPGNGREAHRQREEFEERLANAFMTAFRAATGIHATAHESVPTQDRPGR